MHISLMLILKSNQYDLIREDFFLRGKKKLWAIFSYSKKRKIDNLIFSETFKNIKMIKFKYELRHIHINYILNIINLP